MIEEKELLKLVQDRKKKESKKISKRDEDRHLVEWQIFYLNNLDIFNEEFLEIKLYFFQKQMLLEAWNNDVYYVNASRGISKTFSCSLFANSLALLLPGINIAVAAKTLAQSNKIIDEKIDGIFCTEGKEGSSKILIQMKKDGYIKFGKSKTGDGSVAEYANGSKIFSVVCGEGGRSNRSNIVILDEAVLVDKKDYDSILRPLNEPYKFKSLIIQPKQIYMTSSKTTDNWFYKDLLVAAKYHFKNNQIFKYGFFFGDELTAVANGVHTLGQYESNKVTMNDLSFKEEYMNLWLGEKEGSLYTYESFHAAQKLAKPFYPRNQIQYMQNDEIDYDFKDSDIRYIAMDIAIVGGKKNDNTAIILGALDKDTYQKRVEYVVTANGMNTFSQVALAKRLFYEYKSSYFVYDNTGVGSEMFDIFSKSTHDDERNVDYPAWTVNTDKKLQIVSDTILNEKIDRVSSKTLTDSEAIMIPITGKSELNSEMFLALRKTLLDKKIDLLKDADLMEITLSESSDWLLKTSEERCELTLPFIKTEDMINESISVEMDISNNVVKVKPTHDTKDMFMTLVYFNYFGNKLITKISQEDDYDDEDFDASAWSFLGDVCKV